MRAYTVAISNVTPNTANDVVTLIAPASKAVRVKRVRASGEATASTPMRTVIQRSTAGTTGGGAVTPDKCNTSDSAAGTVAYTSWSAQPTLSGGPHYSESWNSFGGGFDLTLDGREIYLQGAEQLSIRNTIGTGLMSLEVEIEEL